jgi:hypothetical protein
MKKILLLITIGLWQSLIGSCVDWSVTQSSTNPPKPYCWNFELTSFVTVSNSQYVQKSEDVSNKSLTSYNCYNYATFKDGLSIK